MTTTKWGIKQRVLVLALSPAIAISLLLGGYFTSIRLDEITKALTDKGTAITTRLSSAGEYGVFARDTEALRRLARHALTDEISSVAFYNKKGIELASAGVLNPNIEPPDEVHPIIITPSIENDAISFLAPVTLPEVVISSKRSSTKDYFNKATIIGWIKIELERSTTRRKELQLFLHSGIIVLLGLATSTLLALRLGSSVADPILELAEAVKRIKNGDLNTRSRINPKWELGILESGINTMASSLQDVHKKMQSNINRATADLRKTLKTIEVQNVELEIARKEAEHATKVKSEFLASMSHELRTPLNGIAGFVNLLSKTKLNKTQEDYLSTIEKSSNNLLAIISDILDFSKIEAGKLHLDLIDMNIHECIEDTLTLLSPSAHKKHLEIVPIIYNDVPENIVADPLRIKQVITNLLSNSIKFTDNGSIIIRVMLENDIHSNDMVIKMSVTDTGIGLSEQQQRQLFNSFNQTNPNITRRYGGTGLGLVISKNLVEQMGGSIDLESKPGIGSTFWFTFNAKCSSKPSLSQEYKLEKRRVILYEKLEMSRMSILQLLQQWGAEVDIALSYKEIISKCLDAYQRNYNYDLILIGANQIQSEKEALKSLIKKINWKIKVPVGVLINSTEYSLHNEILNYGVNLCLAKPTSRKKLFSAINNLLGQESLDQYQGKDLPTYNVLAIDDNPSNLKLVTVFLENIGVQVTQATNGEDSVNLAKENLYSLILMDLNMPGMDGIQASKEIRKPSNLNSQTPIVVLTAHLVSSKRDELAGAGINDYLSKPIDENSLRASIYKWTHSGTRNIEPIDKPINWSMSLNLAGNKQDLAIDMLDMLIEHLDIDKKNILDAYKQRNFEDLSSHVHKLHGACCYVGVPKLKNHARELEETIARANAEKIFGHVKALIAEMGRVKEFYKSTKFKSLKLEAVD